MCHLVGTPSRPRWHRPVLFRDVLTTGGEYDRRLEQQLANCRRCDTPPADTEIPNLHRLHRPTHFWQFSNC